MIRSASNVLLVALSLAVLACGSEAPGSAPSSSAPASSGAAKTASSAAASAPASTAAASASAASTGRPSFPVTEEPELQEWAKSKVIKVAGSTRNSCETRMVREWLRVQCVNRSAERGTPVSITVTDGRAAGERYKGENLKVVNDITTLIVPVRPGTDFAADFAWEKGTDQLTVKWPYNTGEEARDIKFTSSLEDAAPTSSGSAPPAPAPAAPAGGDDAASPKAEAPLDDVAGLAALPSDDEWKKVAEAKVKGSTDAVCETKVVGDWFRAVCAEVDGKPVKEVLLLKGHRKTQTKVQIAAGIATLTTPYVEGTELHARFVRDGKPRVLVLRWSKGKKPDTIGAFEAPR